jgi:hypothetical protein
VVPGDIKISLEGGEYTIRTSNLLIDKEYFDSDSKEDRCYYAMFRGDTLEDGDWDLGSAVM